MPTRSQRHMREFAHYAADSTGQAVPKLRTNIANQSTNTTATLNVFNNFSGYPKQFSATGLPTGKTINATTGVISGTSSTGTFAACVVTVVNGFGRATSNTFSWTVA
jgi:hypothetical protein